jgi:phosphinothricin acetyltransferase
VRDSVEADVPRIREIYAHHVLHGLGTFEEIPPGLEEMMRRRRAVASIGLPHLCAEIDGRVAGFGYLAPFRDRSAYRFTVETSLYVAADATRRGVGAALLDALLRRAEAAGMRQMLAVVGDRGNAGSIGVHRAAGFREIGTMAAVGFKAECWVDVVIMQRAIGPGDATAPAEHAAR